MPPPSRPEQARTGTPGGRPAAGEDHLPCAASRLKLRAAEANLREAIRLYRKHGTKKFARAGAACQPDSLLSGEDKSAESEPLLREALSPCEKLGCTWGVLADSRRHLVNLLVAQKRSGEAEPLLLASTKRSVRRTTQTRRARPLPRSASSTPTGTSPGKLPSGEQTRELKTAERHK